MTSAGRLCMPHSGAVAPEEFPLDSRTLALSPYQPAASFEVSPPPARSSEDLARRAVRGATIGFAVDLVTWIPVLGRGLRKQGPRSVAVSVATTGAITASAAGIGSVTRGLTETVGFRGWLVSSVLGFGVPFTVVRLGLSAPSRGRILQRVILAAAHSGVQLSRSRAMTVLILYSGLFVGSAEYAMRRFLGVGM